MIARRILGLAMIASASGMACTAIVLGSISDYDGYGVDSGSLSGSSGTSSGNSSSGTSSSSGSVPACSLLSRGAYDDPAHDTACAQCIQANCGSNVAIACNDGGRAEEWFSTMKSCAQHPYEDYGDPDDPTQSGSYGCSTYEKEEEPVIGDPGSDTQKKYEADTCIHDSCMQGALPDCKKCEPSHQKGEGSEVQLLRDDACGQCFTKNCPEVLVECCRSWPMEDFVEWCAYTNVESNYSHCRDIRDAGVPDADYATFHAPHGYSPTDKACAQKLAVCFLNFCEGKGGCAKFPE